MVAAGYEYEVQESDLRNDVAIYVNPMAPEDPDDNTTITSPDGSCFVHLLGGLSGMTTNARFLRRVLDVPVADKAPVGWWCSFCEQGDFYDKAESDAEPAGRWIVERLCDGCAEIALAYTRFYAFSNDPLVIQ